MSEHQPVTNRTQTRVKKGVEPQDPEVGKNAVGFVDSDGASDVGAAKPEKPTPKSSRHRHRHHEHTGKEKKTNKEAESSTADSANAADHPRASEEGEREEEGKGGDDAEDSDLDLDADSTGDVSLLEVFQSSDPKQLERLFSCLSHALTQPLFDDDDDKSRGTVHSVERTERIEEGSDGTEQRELPADERHCSCWRGRSRC